MIANRPRLMRELVIATVADQPDIEIAEVLEDEASIFGKVEQLRPDVLVITLDRSEDRPHLCDVLLERFPHLRILAVAAERDSTIFYWATLDIRSNRIENSEQSILSALRGHRLVASPLSEPQNNPRAN